MHDYVLMIGDGNSAASRGMDSETFYTFKVHAESIDDAIDKLEKEIRAIDTFDYYDGDESYHEYFDSKDPGGGDIWLATVSQDGVFDDDPKFFEDLAKGYYGEYDFAKPEDAAIFGLPPHADDNRFESLKKFYTDLGLPTDTEESKKWEQIFKHH